MSDALESIEAGSQDRQAAARRAPGLKLSQATEGELREKAELALEAARESKLPQVREAHERAARQWLALADFKARRENGALQAVNDEDEGP